MIIAISLAPGDDLIGVKLVSEEDEVLLVTRDGMSIRFSHEDVRPMGRAAGGVKGISLDSKDEVVGMDIARDTADVLIVTNEGFGKRTPVSEYRAQNRGGKGLKALNLTPKTGRIAGVKLVRQENEVMLMTSSGYVIRFQISDISRMGRYAQGVKVMSLEADDQVIGIARVSGKSGDELED